MGRHKVREYMMIEAVNSTLATSAVTKAVAEQQSSANSFAANPERVQRVAQAPYVSPYISVDTNFDRAVLQIRDSDTGDVLNQYPTESQLKAYQRAQAAETQPQLRSQEEVEASLDTEAAQPAPQPEQTSVQQSAPITEAVSVDTQA